MRCFNIMDYLSTTKKNLISNRKIKPQIYSVNNNTVCLYSSNYKIIDITNERLGPHFQQVTNCGLINLFSMELDKINNFMGYMTGEYEKHSWKQIKHMDGYYYHTKLNDELLITIWITKKDKNYKNGDYSINDLITDYCEKKCQHICLLAKWKSDFYFFYNVLDPYVEITPTRIIRSIFLRSFLTKNYIYYHAAAIEYKNKGILLCGNSGKGKTSCLLNFLDSKQGKLIANDKVFIGIDDEQKFRMWGWPTVVTLGVGNLNQYEQLKKFLTSIDDVSCLQDLYRYTPKKEYLNMSWEQMKSLKRDGNKLAISHKQLAELFDKKIQFTSTIDIVVNVDLIWNCTKKSIIKLTEFEQKISILKQNFIENKSDQLCWIGYPWLSNSILDEQKVKKAIDSIDFYSYQNDFRDENLSCFLDEVI